jgi:flagellin
MSVINTNSLSLVAQGNLTKSQSALGTAIERLSSGLRINSAKDDAAGQAIANRFTANIKGLTQAGRNANDGISIAQTTEGALNEINNNLQRVRELTVQAQNGTNSASDIDSIQQEVNERLAEIDRIASQTNFNGTNILKEKTDETNISIQVGANDGETIKIKIGGNESWNLFSEGAKNTPTDKVNGNFRDVDTYGYDVLSKRVTDVNMSTTNAALTAYAETQETFTTGALLVSYTNGVGDTAYAMIDSAAPAGDPALSVTFDKDGKALLGAALTGGDELLAKASVANTVADNALVKIAGPESDALEKIDNALKAVDNQRSDLGAIQNRFESTIANLNNTLTNLSSARSRIEDADYAVEVSNMTRAQILQQAGTSVLAQANQVPQTVLSLLR